MRIAAQILEHLLGSAEGVFGVDHPVMGVEASEKIAPRSLGPQRIAPQRLSAQFPLLVRAQALSGEMRDRMLGWRYSGFSVHNQVRVDAQDPEARKKLAGYMLRAPMSLEKMTYDAKTGTVIYRSKMHAAPLITWKLRFSPRCILER